MPSWWKDALAIGGGTLVGGPLGAAAGIEYARGGKDVGYLDPAKGYSTAADAARDAANQSNANAAMQWQQQMAGLQKALGLVNGYKTLYDKIYGTNTANPNSLTGSVVSGPGPARVTTNMNGAGPPGGPANLLGARHPGYGAPPPPPPGSGTMPPPGSAMAPGGGPPAANPALSSLYSQFGQ